MSYVETGSDVNTFPCLMRRFVFGSALAGAAICVVALACVVPARAAVELVDFYVTFGPDQVLISWVTGSELGTVGFNIFRTDGVEFSRVHRVNAQMIVASGELTGEEYHYTDDDVVPGVTYYYWLEIIDPDEGKVFGPEPKPAPTATSSSTATSTPTATPTPTRTKTPMPTSTTLPTVTPSFTATAAPTSTPAGSPTTTPVLPPPSSPSSTSVVEQRLSPTVTPGGMAQATLTPGAAATEWMPTAAPTTVVVASETPTATTVAWGGDSEPQATGWSSFLFRWSTIQPSTILLLVSLMSLLGALLLSVALALVRKLSL